MIYLSYYLSDSIIFRSTKEQAGKHDSFTFHFSNILDSYQLVRFADVNTSLFCVCLHNYITLDNQMKYISVVLGIYEWAYNELKDICSITLNNEQVKLIGKQNWFIVFLVLI